MNLEIMNLLVVSVGEQYHKDNGAWEEGYAFGIIDALRTMHGDDAVNWTEFVDRHKEKCSRALDTGTHKALAVVLLEAWNVQNTV